MKVETAALLVPAAGTSLALGHFLGVPVLGLVFGLAGGIVTCVYGKPMKLWKVPLTLVASTLSGGALGPFIAAYIRTDAVPEATGVVAMAFLVGAGSQAIVQTGVAAVVNRIRQIGGNQP